MADERVVHLPAKDAKALLRLLDGFQALLREGSLDHSDQRLATGGADLDTAGVGPWQDHLADEVEAACGLLRQSLDGFDPSAVISSAQPSEGAPSTER